MFVQTVADKFVYFFKNIKKIKGYEGIAHLKFRMYEIPNNLKDLDKKPILHTGVVDTDKMLDAVLSSL